MRNGSLVKVGGVSAILVGVSLGMMRVSGIFGIEEFDTTEQIKFDSFNLWTLAVGVALLRLREPVKVNAGA